MDHVQQVRVKIRKHERQVTFLDTEVVMADGASLTGTTVAELP